ncbi:DUF4238 domain-containing protein [Winogradskyella forsetii]|uniref:DUF4238 domain-containing protein n=1 Tax=Winogradskyella forsetii TaxID=2686077 RepID=UPI0015B82412|nr:DUF4238 domain-containing protein [Winogradskyella forsetii]
MSITKKNHYNPCFWTAYWNHDYYHNHEYRKSANARNQKIQSLNLKGNKILPSKTEDVFFEKRMGLANVSENEVLDFENFFTTSENLIKEPLFSIIEKNEIDSLEEKTHISSFISDMILRHYKNFNGLIDDYNKKGKQKIELFIDLKNDYSTSDFHKAQIIPLLSSEWIIYQSKDFKFPLGDNPILMNDKNILFALSPKMLIRINYKKKVLPDTACVVKHKMNYFTYRNFMRRTIISSDREIIFNEVGVLEKWRKSKVYQKKQKN